MSLEEEKKKLEAQLALKDKMIEEQAIVRKRNRMSMDALMAKGHWYRKRINELSQQNRRLIFRDPKIKSILEAQNIKEEHIVIGIDGAFLFAYHEDGVIQISIEDYSTKRLPYQKIISSNYRSLKVNFYNDQKQLKWNLLDMEGKVLLQKPYDYIEFNSTENRFCVFVGDYNWIENIDEYDAYMEGKLARDFHKFELDLDDIGESYFDKYVDNGHDGFVLYGKAGIGKWGVVDRENNFIIPAEYDWIEEYDEASFLLNKGGSSYHYHDDTLGNVRYTTRTFIIGGTWEFRDKDGTFIRTLDPKDDIIVHNLVSNSIMAWGHYSGQVALKFT